jgi:ApaG protein
MRRGKLPRGPGWDARTPVEPAADLRSNTRMDEPQYSVSVTAEPEYLAERSSEREGRYVFAYTVRIRNTGTIPAQLISRHWIITEADDKVHEVRGLGVVGNQPLLQPGEQFEYTSGAEVASPVATMRGSYTLQAADGRTFQAPIPEFTLAAPRTLH